MLGFPNFDPQIWTWEDHIRDNVDKQIRHGYSELLDHMPSALLVGSELQPILQKPGLASDSHALAKWKSKAETVILLAGRAKVRNQKWIQF